MRCRGLAISITALLLTAGVAHATFTTPACLAKRVTAWGKLRQCQRKEQAKAILGKTSDSTKCQTTFDTAVGKLDASASKANVACRYLDDADGTITDAKTGLMWLVATQAGNWLSMMSDNISACDGWSPNGTSLFPVCSAYSDWRVPNIVELQSIIDLGAPGCNLGSPCIDPIFGSAPFDSYWSSTTDANFPNVNRWWVDFRNGNVASVAFESSGSPTVAHVRVVRDGL